jgi:2-hydroxycyclohexanecarboxyl-CoA dehydrogenase
VDLGLRHRSVVVTGAASNLGRAIALGFAAEGARLVVVDMDEVHAEGVAALALELGSPAARVVRADVTEPTTSRGRSRTPTSGSEASTFS